jgi:hypothetical protein
MKRRSKMKIFPSFLQRYLFLFILFSTLTACGTIDVAMSPNKEFLRSGTLSLVPGHNDYAGIGGMIAHYLTINGFNVISDHTNKEKISGVANPDSINLTKSNELSSMYILKYSYNYSLDPFTAIPAVYSFNAIISDSTNGETVLSAYFDGKKPPNMLIKEFAAALKEKSK